jgi:hypothetical protein
MDDNNTTKQAREGVAKLTIALVERLSYMEERTETPERGAEERRTIHKTSRRRLETHTKRTQQGKTHETKEQREAPTLCS